ncbi:glycosyltransferase family 4 protein [bacterium]|nr:glycosyltransferase family 4 protein [bacterium]
MKIAVVDLLFNWPPDGGARTDVKEVAERLAHHHQVRLFVPSYQRFFPRGRIDRQFAFEVELLPFRTRNWNAWTIGRAYRRALEAWGAQRVYITDGWYLKPRVFAALAHYRPLVRFYAYETLCLRFHGIFFRHGTNCPVRYLDAGLTTWATCARCALPPLRRPQYRQFMQEALIAGAFLPGYRRAVKRMLREASALICYNEFIAAMLRSHNPNVRVVPSGLHPGDFPLQPPRQGGETFEVGMVGRAGDHTKGFPVLLESCRRLHGRGVPLRLHCTWSEDNLPPEPFLVRHDWMPPAALPDFYRELDVCVVPSVWQEPFGIVALEAMASGRPLICTRVGGLGSIPIHGESGLVVPPADAAALESALWALYSDPALRRRLAEAGRRRVEEHFTWDRIVEEHYLPLFEGRT